MSSTTTTGTDSATIPYNTYWPTATSSATGGVSSTLYLFTFLITILVLGAIAGSLLLRAYVVRRRFRQRVAEAIARGEPLPEMVEPTLLGTLQRQKKDKPLGARPALWEAEMRREMWDAHDGRDDGDEGGDDAARAAEDVWAGVTHSASRASTPEPPPPALPPVNIFRDIFETLRPTATTTLQPPPMPARQASSLTVTSPTTFAVPASGSDVVLGVLIALPVDERTAGADRWHPADPDEAEVPEVVFGVLSTRVS